MTRFRLTLVSLAIVLFDALTKWAVMTRIELHDSIPVIPRFLELAHVRNTGAAFGIGANTESRLVPILLNGGALAVFVVVVVYALRTPVHDTILQCALHLILGGAVGNLIDRFRFGYVIDFVDVSLFGRHWPAFNVADAAICLGILLLFLDMRRKPDEAPAPAEVA